MNSSRLFAAVLACLACTSHAQSIVTDPSPPVGYIAFQATVTAPISGKAFNSGFAITEGNRIDAYLAAFCDGPCPAPTVQTATFTIGGVPPGTYTLTIHQWTPSRPSPVAQTTVVVSATNATAEFAYLPSPAAAFLPIRVSVTALLPHLNFITPEVDVRDGAIVVYLNGSCGFPECPNGSRATKQFTLPALLPGTYDLIVHPWGKLGPPGAPLLAKLTIPAGDNYQGLWWRSPAGAETGWGIQVAHQGQSMFATWFTYDTDGSPTWLVMPNGGRRGTGVYSGTLYRVRALPSSAEVNLVRSSQTDLLGGATFTFTDRDNGVFSYQVGDTTQSKPITRQRFASPAPTCSGGAPFQSSTYFQDLWWNMPEGSEAGWGVQVAHQGDTLFATVFAYDRNGGGTWLVMSEGRRTGPGTYSGVLYRTRGPAFSADPWRNDAVSVVATGRGTFTFTSAQFGTFSYTLDSAPAVEVRKSITRQVFDAFITACN